MSKSKGITLIALVVTIVILIILAGTSIAFLTSDNGVISEAQAAKIETEKKGVQEQIDIMAMESTNKKGYTDKEKLLGKLEELPDGKEIVDDDEYIYVIYPNYEFEIEVNSGKVAEVEVEVSEDKTPEKLDGDGTTEKPYKIESVEDLITYLNATRHGETFEGKKLILVKSLNIKSKNSYVNSETTQFGDYNKDGKTEGLMKELTDANGTGIRTGFAFSGTFEGNGKEIRNIYININISENSFGWWGFLGDLDSGEIKNLNLHGKINFNYVGTKFNYVRIAGISGRNQSGVIENCTSEVDINANFSEITQADSERTLYIGGIVGNNEGIINNCINRGNITLSIPEKTEEANNSTVVNVGGISAKNESEITNVINYGNVNVKKSKAGSVSTTKDVAVGGICGRTWTTIKNAVNLGNITGEGDEELEIAGIIGKVSEDYGLIENVSNIGIISGIGRERLAISGIAANGKGVYKNAYNIGTINDNGINTRYMGAIVGDVQPSTACEGCIYLKDSAPYAAQSTSYTGITEADSLNIRNIVEYMNVNVDANNSVAGNTQWKTWRQTNNKITF